MSEDLSPQISNSRPASRPANATSKSVVQRAPSAVQNAFPYIPPLVALPVLGIGIAGLLGRGPRWLRRRPVLSGVATLGAAVVLARSQFERFFTEEPRYTVERRIGDLEIRQYQPRVVAETTVVGGSFDEALNEGFRRLAGYIFGGNEARQRIAMTSPVTAFNAKSGGERIAMTAPVNAEPTASGHKVRFTMPKERTVASLPVPQDKRVRLRATEAERVAVLRFRGTYRGSRIAEKMTELLCRVREAGLEARGEAQFAGYDNPSTLPFLRRVEVWVPIA